MSRWLEVFRNEKAREEGDVSFACVGCGSKYKYKFLETVDGKPTPPDGVCQ